MGDLGNARVCENNADFSFDFNLLAAKAFISLFVSLYECKLQLPKA